MSPEYSGVLDFWEKMQRQKGNEAGAEMARVLRDQYGDLMWPERAVSDQKPTLTPPTVIIMLKQFVKAALVEGAHLKKPPVQRLSEEGWIRGRNILGSYLISAAPQKDISRIYGLSQTNTSLVIHRTIKYLWQNSSPSLQREFSLPDVSRKLMSLQSMLYTPSDKPPILPPEGEPIHTRLKEALTGVNFTFINPQTREFLKQALAEGKHLNPPPGMNSSRWINYRNIFGTYILSHASLGEVGKIYGISRERARQINEMVLEYLLPEYKGRGALHRRAKYQPKEWLLVKDGLGSEIVELLEEGLSPDQITSRFENPKRKAATRALKMLRELKFDMTRIKYAPGEYLRIQQELLKEDLSNEETQTLLDQINSTRGIEALAASGVIISVTNLLRSAGFHYKIGRDEQLFYDSLIDAGIPLGKVESIVRNGPQKGKRYYYFIAQKHRQKAEDALKSSPELKPLLENPVKQISGPESKIPNTTAIMRKRRVVSLWSLLREFGIGPNGKKDKELIRVLKSLDQVPLFEYTRKGTLYLWETDAEQARSFIAQRLAETTHKGNSIMLAKWPSV